ncbi:MAG: DM13 domain-containing protein [Anaerolineae bacterium]
MKKVILLVALLLGIPLALSGCGGGGEPSPAPTPTPALIPTATPPLPPAPPPTPAGPFLPKGYVAQFQGGEHGIAGQARVVADRQVLIQGFSYDGQGKGADIRLARQGQLDPPLAILMADLRGPYQNTALLLTVPPDLRPGAAEVIAVYSAAEGRAYAVGVFGEPPAEVPTPTPTGGPFVSPPSTPSP